MSEHDPIRFGRTMTPEEKDQHRRKVEMAQQRAANPTSSYKGREPVGSVARPSMPSLLPHQEEDVSLPQQPGGPVVPRPPGSSVLRPQTEQMLKAALAEAGKPQQAQEEEEAEVELPVEEDSFAGINLPGLRNNIERIFDNPQRRKEIEGRCQEMRFEDLLMNDEVRQKVPIIPDKFVVVYRSITPDESLFIKRFIAGDQTKSDGYLLEKYGLCQLTCSLVSINGKELPSHLDKNGEPDEKLFAAKLRIVQKKSVYIIQDLYVNYGWFDYRVRKLVNPAFLGNG